jgi:PhnB protein
MRWNPHLSFDGQCEAAFKFYEECLGGKVLMLMTYGASPVASQTAPEWRSKILHASFALGDQILTGGDAPPGHYQKPQGISVLLQVGAVPEAERIFAALAENGVVQMPIERTFWAARFGMLVDRFGTPWLINCSTPT